MPPTPPCFILRRPLAGVACATACGMAVAASGRFPLSFFLAAAPGLLLAAWLLSRTRAAALPVFCCVAAVAACRYLTALQPLSADDIRRLQPQLPIDRVELIGTITEPPEYRPYRSGGSGACVLQLRCEGMKLPASPGSSRRQTAGDDAAVAIDRTGGWQRCRGFVQVRVAGATAETPLLQGQRIYGCGTLSRRSFPGGAAFELRVDASGGWEVLSPPSSTSPVIWGQRLRRAAARTLSRGLEEYSAQRAVYQALLLGYRKAIPPEINRQFRRTGTLHIFAISGLHVGMVALFISVGLKTAGVPRDRWGLVLLPLLLGYAAATGMKTSALRAVTMAAVYFLAPLFRRRPDIPVSIAFAAVLLLVCKPEEILSAGFIFSFTVVSFLVMFFSAVPPRWLSGGEGWAGKLRVYTGSLVITSTAAFLASAPLTALFFGSVSPVALVGNLIVVPLTFCIVLSGWLSICCPPAAGIFNPAALVFIDLLLGTTGLLARLPGAQLPVPTPPPAAVLFWYAGWISLFTHARTAKQRTAAGTLVVLAILLTFLAPLS